MTGQDDAGGPASADPAGIEETPFRVRWPGYDRDQVRTALAELRRRAAEPAPEPSADGVLEEARHRARQIVEEAEGQAAATLEQARLDAERRTLVVIQNAKQIYESAVDEAETIRVDAERQAAEIIAAAHRQLDLAVELKVELRRELGADDHDSGPGLRLLPDPPPPPSLTG